MFAPRRVPPCFTTSVSLSKSFMKEMAPLATPLVFLTTSPLGRTRQKENPVPPPDFCIRLCAVSALAMPSMESGTGST